MLKTNSPILPFSARTLFLPLVVFFLTGISALTSRGQLQSTSARENQPLPASEIESVWRFGLKISVTEGFAEGIYATAPVPIECPEQTVELIDEQRDGPVGKIRFKDLKPLGRQMGFRVARVQGDEVTAAVKYKITKRTIVPPENPDRFQFSKKAKGKLRLSLGPSPFIESKHKRIIEIAEKLQSENADKTAWRQVEAIYQWVRQNIQYEFDTQIHSCLDALDSGKGDCEELSSLFIAICRARKIPARAVWIPGHTYPEFYLVDENGKGHWFPCQAAGSYQFGQMNEQRPILQKGDRFRIPGKRELQRYAQPTLKSTNAVGQISIAQIAEQVE